MKKSSILSAVVLVIASLFTACGRQGPVPPLDETPPTVSSTIPANGTVNVPVYLPGGILITFSKKMDDSTINDQTITLADGQNGVPGLVTYTYTTGVPTAVFTPSSSLNPTTLYKITVDINVKDSYGIPMAAPYLCSFGTGTVQDTIPPTVVSTTPRNGDIGVMPNAALSVTFSEPVDSQTISFIMSTGSTTIPCTMSYSGGTTAIFTPLATLAYSTPYTATVSAGVKDLAGNPMPNSYIWSFVTSAAPDTTPPGVIATTPQAGATNVAMNIAPSITFSEPVDQQTISFILSTGSTTIPCTMSYSGTTAIFTPLNILASTTSYTATVSAGVKDLAGNAMSNSYIWSFTTGTAIDTTLPIVAATTPTVGAAGVAVNTAPSVTFSEPVDPTTITFTLSGGGATLPCTMSYSGVTAIFKPSSNLKKNTLYTARVSAGVRDLAGNAMPNDYFWSFTTSKN